MDTMKKLQIQNFAKLPNKYVTVGRSRGLSVLEEKLVYMLINSMQKRYESTHKLETIDYKFIASDVITFNDFCQTMQIGSKNNNHIIESIWKLHLFGLAIYKDHKTKFIHLFKEFELDDKNQTIQYVFDDNFINYFTGVCKDFFCLDVQEVISLSSSYAIRIYQLLKSKLNMNTNEHNYTIIELKKILNLENKHMLYGHLKANVLEVAKQQINSSEASKFSIDYEDIKTGKAVTSVNFIIQNKGTNYYAETNQLAKYQIDILRKLCSKWKKEHDKNSVVSILSLKILEELKHKKPILALVKNYLEAIKPHVKDDLINVNL